MNLLECFQSPLPVDVISPVVDPWFRSAFQEVLSEIVAAVVPAAAADDEVNATRGGNFSCCCHG